MKVTLIAHGAHKVDGNAYEPLSDEVKADFQKDVDEVGAEFDAAVARGRGVSKQVVLETFGQGKVFRGKKAIALGMADKLSTYSALMARLTKGRTATTAVRAAVAATSDTPEDDTATISVPATIHVHQFDADGNRYVDGVLSNPGRVMGAKRADDPMPPNDDGECEDGYELGKDGMCHLVPTDEAKQATTEPAVGDDSAIISTILAGR